MDLYEADAGCSGTRWSSKSQHRNERYERQIIWGSRGVLWWSSVWNREVTEKEKRHCTELPECRKWRGPFKYYISSLFFIKMNLFARCEWLVKMILSCVIPLPSVFMMTVLCYFITIAPPGWIPSGNTREWNWPNCFVNYFVAQEYYQMHQDLHNCLWDTNAVFYLFL